MEDVIDLVAVCFACPSCGERDCDQLIWQEDNPDYVRCQPCGFTYRPDNRTYEERLADDGPYGRIV